MISISQFKANFLALFRLMRDTGMYVDVHNRGHVYRIHVEDMKYKIDRKYKRRSYVGAITTDRCPDCKKLIVNGLCMNIKCPSNADDHTVARPS